MQKLVGDRLPKISEKMSQLLIGTVDFVGLNHYTTLYARNDKSHIRKRVLQDALSDAAVITTRTNINILFQHLKIIITIICLHGIS